MTDPNSTPPPLPLPPPPPSPPRGRGCLKFALIGCGALVALVVIAIAVGGIWWKRNGAGLQDQAMEASRDGARFGMVRDEQACFAEGRRRAAESTSFQGTFTVGAFVRACMEYSKPTPGFCDNVPPPTSIGRTAAWQAQRCGEDMLCRNVSQVQQAYCNDGRPKRTPADTLLMQDDAGSAGSAGNPVDTGSAGGAGSAADSSSF